MTHEISSADISKAAQRVFSREELQKMSEASLLSLGGMIERAMKERGPDLKQAELEGIREIVTEHLYPTNFGALHEQVTRRDEK